MSYYDPDSADAANVLQWAALNPIHPGDMGPGAFSGALGATGKGLLQGVYAQPALLAVDAAVPALTPLASSIDSLFGGTTANDYLQRQRRAQAQLVKDLMPGPQTGLVGQMTYGFGSILPQAIGGFMAGGPAGSAAVVGTLQGHAARRMAELEGVDSLTAVGVGTLEGGAAALGVAMPASFGLNALRSAGVAAGANIGLGVGQRAGTSELLKARGYDKLAEQYVAFDATSMVIDGVLGATFGVFGARRDAALAANKQQHLEVDTAPGVPADPPSRAAHGKAMDKAVDDLAHDREVDVSATGVDSAAFVANRARLEAEVLAALPETPLGSLLDEVDALRTRAQELGLAPADEALFEGQRLTHELTDATDTQAATGPRDLPGQATGRAGEVFVGDRSEPVRFIVVEADTLGATIGKAVNQFRDRTRAASQQQIGRIAADLQFGRLGEAPTMAEGAPTLAQDGATVIGGNGRVAAVQLAYQLGRGEGYKAALMQRAAEFGLTPEQVQGFQNPILVRQFTREVDIRAAAILSNEGGALRMSALEQAKVDAERMPDLRGVELPDSGDLTAVGARDFVTSWLTRYPQSELGALVAADGRLSAEGQTRLTNAILFSAYGDSPTLARLVEADDDMARNLAGALVKAAPSVADARAAIAAGDLHDLDVQPMLLQAIDTTQMLRAEGMKLDTWLAQNDMFGSGVGPEAILWMEHFKANSRSQRAVAEAITGYYDAVRALGNPRQAGMFEAQPPSRGEILRAVLAGETLQAAPPPAVVERINQLRQAAVEAKAAVDKMVDDGGALGDDYFAASDKSEAAMEAFTAELVAIDDGVFALEAKAKDGRKLMLNPSAQQPGKYQLTRFDREGEPWGDSQYSTKASAVGDFLREVDVGTVQDYEGRIEPAVQLRQRQRETAPEMARLAPEQRPALLDQYAKAEAEKPAFDALVAKVSAEVRGVPKLAGLKGVARATEKIVDDYAGDPTKIKDLLRATIEVDNVADAQAAVEAILKQFDVTPGGRRNLLDPAVPSHDGYRDAKFNIKVGDIVAELQVSVPEMLKAKNEVHHLYEERRTLEGKHKNADGSYPPEVQARVDELNAQMRVVYEDAWARVTSALKSASDNGAPLRRAESGSNTRGGDTSQAAQAGTPGTPALIDTGMSSTSNKSARGPKSGSDMVSTSEPIVSRIAENATMDAAVRQVLDDRPNAQVLAADGSAQPAGLAIRAADAKISQAQADAAAFPEAAACALR